MGPAPGIARGMPRDAGRSPGPGPAGAATGKSVIEEAGVLSEASNFNFKLQLWASSTELQRGSSRYTLQRLNPVCWPLLAPRDGANATEGGVLPDGSNFTSRALTAGRPGQEECN